MARRSGLVEDTLYIATRIPWWASVAIAIAIYFALAPVATMELPKVTGPGGVGTMAAAQLYKTVALVLHIMLPMLFLVGAVVSAVRALFDSNLFDRLARTQRFDTITWHQFERIVGEAFRRMGYTVDVTGGNGPDGGVDVVVRRDGKRYLVQCKHWRNSTVGVKTLREHLGVIVADGADGGFVVTTGRFTDEAKRFAAKQGIHLLDGDEFKFIAKELAKEQQSLSAPPVSSRSQPPERPAAPVVACPSCGTAMVKRIAKRGPNQGMPFWGCPRYPDCRGTRPA